MTSTVSPMNCRRKWSELLAAASLSTATRLFAVAAGTNCSLHRAAAVPGRGEKGNACTWMNPTSHTTSSVCANFRLPFAGETNDHVRGEGRSVKCRSNTVDHAAKIVAAVLAVHSSQDRVRSALQRQMEMRNDLAVCTKDSNQIVGHVARLQAGETQPMKSRNSLADRIDQSRQGRLGAVGNLPATQRRRMAVCTRKIPVSTISTWPAATSALASVTASSTLLLHGAGRIRGIMQ